MAIEKVRNVMLNSEIAQRRTNDHEGRRKRRNKHPEVKAFSMVRRSLS